MRSTERRVYRKTKRSEDEARTAARIVDAAETLHGTLGPSRTTIAAIAATAGVTRATVYRHFPDEETLFLACSGQWLARQRLPDPEVWSRHADPVLRLRAGLTDLYRYYRDGHQMLAHIHRDAEVVPTRLVERRRAAEEQWLACLLQPWPGRAGKILRAATAHAASFTTWQSLCLAQGLSNRAAVDLMVTMVAGQAGSAGRTSTTAAGSIGP
ncbi:AcrR family transcriptional regulator [Nocardioides ginsengisegetis]|uniref:AcrR family transcriptional regulator n=1 Tax=Nocardioides ginsengisegetis TaxID=661491 RepID=A0A7W3IXW1_9ACTN|nr:TetR/AcrR family transcriptional regulator [Nocardioides ginsengisegetis]MBA8802643.1 AcrR family transcriptional regulator [Nocardioides ginsengisegetis]